VVSGAPPLEQPDEVFPVAASNGTVKWSCAKYAQVFDGAGGSDVSRITTGAGNRSVWMTFANPAG
jgi:hypothetical protein